MTNIELEHPVPSVNDETVAFQMAAGSWGRVCLSYAHLCPHQHWALVKITSCLVAGLKQKYLKLK